MSFFHHTHQITIQLNWHFRLSKPISGHGGIAQEVMTDDNDLDVYAFLSEAVWSVTPDNAKGWFQHSGYSV
jgi:hypothetical protein